MPQAPMAIMATDTLPMIRTPHNQARTTMTKSHNLNNPNYQAGPLPHPEPTTQYPRDPTNSQQQRPSLPPHHHALLLRVREAAASLRPFVPVTKNSHLPKNYLTNYKMQQSAEIKC